MGWFCSNIDFHMLSTAHFSGGACEAAAPSQQEQFPKSTLRTSLSPGRSFPFPQPAQAHTDIPNRAWCTFPRQEFSTVVSLPTDLARHYSGVNIPVLYFATWPGQDPSFLGFLAHWERWDARILLPNDLLHRPQQLNSWFGFNQIPVSVQYYIDA